MKRYYIEYEETTRWRTEVEADGVEEAKEDFWFAYNVTFGMNAVEVDGSGPQNIEVREVEK